VELRAAYRSLRQPERFLSYRSLGRSKVDMLRLCWSEVGMAYGYLLLHVPRPLVDVPIRTAGRLAPSRGPCAGVVEAA